MRLMLDGEGERMVYLRVDVVVARMKTKKLGEKVFQRQRGESDARELPHQSCGKWHCRYC